MDQGKGPRRLSQWVRLAAQDKWQAAASFPLPTGKGAPPTGPWAGAQTTMPRTDPSLTIAHFLTSSRNPNSFTSCGPVCRAASLPGYLLRPDFHACPYLTLQDAAGWRLRELL